MNNKKKTVQHAASTYLGQPMPSDERLEAAVLGAMLIDSTCFFMIQTSAFALNQFDFYNDRHAKIWEAICKLGIEQKPIDLLTATAELSKMGYIEAVGGGYYLVELTNRVASTANVEFHVSMLKLLSVRRSIIEQCYAAASAAYQPEIDPLDTLGEVQRGLADISNLMGKSAVDAGELAQLVFDKSTVKDMISLPTKTGFCGLDKSLGGGIYEDDFLTLLGGRPGSGKTAFLLGLALEKIKVGKPVAIFSYEMPAATLMLRLYAAFTTITAQDLRSQNLDNAQLFKIGAAKDWFMQRAHLLHIFDCEGMDLGLLAAKIAKAKMDGIEDIYIDHFGEIPNPVKGNEEEGNALKIRTLRNLGKSMLLRITILVQLRKPSNGATAVRPTLSDIKGSSVISESAANIFLLHEEDGVREVLIDKCRNSGVGEVEMLYRGEFYKWESLEGAIADLDSFGQSGQGQDSAAQEDAFDSPIWQF